MSTKKYLTIFMILIVLIGLVVGTASATPKSPHNDGFNPNDGGHVDKVKPYKPTKLDNKIDNLESGAKKAAKKASDSVKKAVKKVKKTKK